MHNSSDNQTSLDLNGPILSYPANPQAITIITGTAATFAGFATVSYPIQVPANPASPTGVITYRWYDQNGPLYDDPVDDGGEGITVAGAGTTILKLYNVNNPKTVYLRSDYIPSAYGLPGLPITAGTARSTGYANNEPLDSTSVNITVIPKLQITSEPLDGDIALNTNLTFSTSALLTDNTTSSIQYQWQLNGIDITNGTFSGNTTPISSNVIFTIVDDANNTTTIVDFTQVSTYSNFIPGRSYTISVSQNITTKLTASGAGGGASLQRASSGGRGGLSKGTFTFLAGQTYKLVVGSAGQFAQGGGYGGGGNGGDGAGLGGGGGGYTGLFLTSVSKSNAIIIAGGGGGGSNDPGYGGDGGGTIGGSSSNAFGNGGSGGGQATGGVGYQSGSALQGGNGAAGGGGGYFGGGSGIPAAVCCSDGAGGGGSGYLHPTLLTSSSTTTGQGSLAAFDGVFVIEYVPSSYSTASFTASGATTSTLTISGNTAGLNNLRCKITHPTAPNSPLYSRYANYTVVTPRPIINIEQYGTTPTATKFSANLGISSYTFNAANVTDIITLYAVEKNITVEMELFGPKGSNNGGFVGGEGGYSKVQFTMTKNDEYVIASLNSGTPFVYRKASLIAVVGAGGNAGISGNGGKGGGIGIAGASGTGNGNGTGGSSVASGTLSYTGIVGSLSSVDPISPDTKATVPNGGRTIPCPRGDFWYLQGYNACDSLGSSQFYLADGTQVINSATINRGFKAGYGIRDNAGAGSNSGGNGGPGATGGNGGTTGGGGGGGSGYTDGSITVVTAISGGNTGAAKVTLKLIS